jgi:hypothetical protein
MTGKTYTLMQTIIEEDESEMGCEDQPLIQSHYSVNWWHVCCNLCGMCLDYDFIPSSD